MSTPRHGCDETPHFLISLFFSFFLLRSPCAASLGALYATDLALKAVFTAQGWSFPAPLAGMFIIFGTLCGLTALKPTVAQAAVDAVRPGLDWIAKWLPLFYLPTLVVTPIAVTVIPPDAISKILAVVVLGTVVSLVMTAQAAVWIRTLTKTETKPIQVLKSDGKKSPYNRNHWVAWGAVAAVSFVFTLVFKSSPAAAPPAAFMLACTILGHLVGNAWMPANVKAILHPIITTVLVTETGAAVLAAATGTSIMSILKMYLAKGTGPMGAGDLLMSFLGCVILSFGFRVYEQRAVLRRHAAEIAGSALFTSLFSLFSTAGLAKALGLTPALALALAPRSVTVALAIPIAQQLGVADIGISIAATAVLLTGLVGANVAQLVLDRFRYTDPIVRGLATAGASHGLGTAALAAKEPEALPYCALGYALTGIVSTLLVCVPAIRTALLAVAGI